MNFSDTRIILILPHCPTLELCDLVPNQICSPVSVLTYNQRLTFPTLLLMQIVDVAVAIQILKPGCAKTFDEYRMNIFCPFLQSLLRTVQRTDVVFDRYLPGSLKSA